MRMRAGRCGQDIPDLQNVKFCIKCGLVLSHVNKYKKLPRNEMKMHLQYEAYLPRFNEQKFFIGI